MERSSPWGEMGSTVSLQHQDTGSIPSPAQRVKVPVLPQLQCRRHLWLRSDPWPRELHMPQGGQKKRKLERKIFNWSQSWEGVVGNKINGRIIMTCVCLHKIKIRRRSSASKINEAGQAVCTNADHKGLNSIERKAFPTLL